jgi:integrase
MQQPISQSSGDLARLDDPGKKVIPLPNLAGNGRFHNMQVEIRHGSVLCAKCSTTLRTDGPCPKCGYKSACIKIGYKRKQPYYYYHDEELKALTFGTALDTLLIINREIANRRFDPNSRTRSVIEARKFFAAWDEFMKSKEELIPSGQFAWSTYETYQTHFRTYLVVIGDKDIRKIDDKDFKKVTGKLAGQSYKYTRNVFATMLTFMYWAQDEKHCIETIPAFPLFPGKPLSQSAKRESLSVEEQDETFALIPEIHRPIFIFSSEVGCRPGEAGLIQIQDIDRNGVLHIRRTFSRYEPRNRTKEGSIRHITLSDVAIEIVKKQMVDPETGVFRTKGLLFKNPFGRPKWGPYRPAYLRDLWREAVGYDFPDLYAATRTSFATQIAESNNISEKEWMKTTGHDSKEAADRYFHQRPSRQRQIVNARRKSSVAVLPFKRFGYDNEQS